MTFFAGIIRHDHLAVPENWMEPLAGLPLKDPVSISYGQSCAFACCELQTCRTVACGSVDESHALFLVDARVDSPHETCKPSGAWGDFASAATDADLVVAAYGKLEEELVSHLVGEFALAVWKPSSRRLFLARDRLGSRTIYYFASQTLFAFATDLRALLALPFVPKTINEEKVVDYLCKDGSGPAGTTFYEAIYTIPSAHTLILDGELQTLAPYWHPAAVPISPLKTDEEYVQELRQRITAAVECRLKGGKKIAVHLSGGLDSSAVACIAARCLKREGRRLLAICSMLPGGYMGPESDERCFVEAVLAQEDNIDVVWVEPTLEKDPFGASARWFQTLGQPYFSTVTHIEEMLGEAGAAHGVDLVLSGFGGDFFVSTPGHNIIYELFVSGRWQIAFSKLKSLHREQGSRWSQLLKHEILAPLLRPYLFSSKNKTSHCAARDFVQRVCQRRGRLSRPSAANQISGTTHELMRFIIAPGHVEHAVSSIRQVFIRQFSQELCFPLMDMRLIELMLETPVQFLLQDGWHRGLMRRAMKGILPEVIRMRPDKGGAFDPAISSRVVAHRPELTKWAEATEERKCWTYVDRVRFLEVLAAVKGASRSNWSQELFNVVISGGIIARFIEWHQKSEEQSWP